MMPWDWIGIVTMRSDTFRSTLTIGKMTTRPGAFSPIDATEAEDDAPFVLVHDVEREGKQDETSYSNKDDCRDQCVHVSSPSSFGAPTPLPTDRSRTR